MHIDKNSNMNISSTIKGQSGAVLVVALILLTVLTLIGVTQMSSSTLEMRVASNSQQQNIAFQGAQSRLDFVSRDHALNPIDFLVALPDPEDPATWPVQTCDPGDGCIDGPADTWTATATIELLGCGKGLGSSLEAGKGVSRRVFEAEATGMTASGTSRSVQRQGLRFPVKACETET